MKIFTNHRLWWALLLAGTTIVSAITSYTITFIGLISSILGHLLFAVGISVIPWIVYLLLGKPMNSEQFMATITVGWLILAAANLLV